MRAGLALFALIVWIAAAWFYTWNPSDHSTRWLTPKATSQYHELTDGFLAGHLYLPIKPDPMMSRLADPYDPATNAPYRVDELSYFADRYYFYPSALPVLMLFAPVKMLSGQHLLSSRACELLALGGLALSLLGLLTLHGRFFRSASVSLVAGGMVALALCQGYYVVLRSESYNLVPITCAYFWAMCSLGALLRALLSAEIGRTAWLAIASLTYGLAIASRPNYLFGAVALLVPVVFWWRADGWRPSRTLLCWICAISAPLVMIAFGLLAYNQARFGTVTEFGIRFQLGTISTRHVSGLSLSNVPENARNYFFRTGEYHPTFPFVTTSHWAALGVLWHVPVILLSLLLFSVGRTLRGAGLTALLLPLTVAAANLLFLLIFPNADPELLKSSANARYLLDFLPTWILLAAGAVLATDSVWQAHPLRRRLLQAGAAALLLVSVLAAASLDFDRFPPNSYRSLARLLNRPAWFWEQMQGVSYGPVEIELTLPTDKPHNYEPLLSSGNQHAGDLLYIFYESPQSIRLGFVSISAKGPMSDSIAVDYTRPHTFELHLGSLYPDISHPLLAGHQPAQIARFKRWLQVKLDGQIVFDVPLHLQISRATPPQIGGTSFLQNYCAEHFTGRILSSRHLSIPPPSPVKSESSYGPVRLRLRFPTDKAGQTEPLVSTGIPLAGDLLAVTYGEDNTVRFILDHWGHSSVTTDWIPLDYDAGHELEITAGSLFPPLDHPRMAGLSPYERQQLRDQLQVRLDGRVVLDTFQTTYPSLPFDVFIGRNALGSSVALDKFTGSLQSVERGAWPLTAR